MAARFKLNNPIKAMGDKSPKSKQKDKGQKQGKAAASNKEKQRVIDSKKAAAAPPPAKKKK